MKEMRKSKLSNCRLLQWQCELLQMGEDEKIAGYVSKLHNLIHLMEDCGETLTDKMIIDKVMRMLTFHFGHVIVAI